MRASEFKQKVLLVWPKAKGFALANPANPIKNGKSFFKYFRYFRVTKIVSGDFKHLIASIKSDYCQSRHFELEELDHLPNLTLCIPCRDALFQKRTFIDFENKSI